MENTKVFGRSIGIMAKKMKTTIVYWAIYRDTGTGIGNDYSHSFWYIPTRLRATSLEP